MNFSSDDESSSSGSDTSEASNSSRLEKLFFPRLNFPLNKTHICVNNLAYVEHGKHLPV